MRVCIKTLTGAVIEMQSSASAGTLLQNAVNCGFNINEVEEREVTQKEYEALCPAPEVAAYSPRLTADDVVELLKTKGVLDDTDVQSAISAKVDAMEARI